MPPSNLTGAPPSMDPISALINLQTLTIPSNSNINGDTQITNSINQLRSFSTALSEFISRYDELNNHIGFINSSIDGIKPNYSRLLETSCDRTVTDVVSVQNPSQIEKTKFWRDSEEIDALKTTEAADLLNNSEEIEVCEKNNVDIDSLEKIEVADNDLLQNDTRCQDIDVSGNHVEIDSLNSGFLHDYDELDALKMAEVADVSKDYEEIDVLKDHVDIDTLEKPEIADNHAQIDTRGQHIVVSENHVEVDSLNCSFSQDYDEFDASKKPEVADVLKDRVGIDSLKKPEVADNHVQIDTCGLSDDAGEIYVSENHVQIDSFNSGFSHGYDELDASKKPEVADESEDREEIDEFENRVEIDSLKQPEVADVWMNPEEIEVCEDPVEIDSLKKLEVANNPEEIDVFKNFEVDVSENHVEIDGLNKQEESVPKSSSDETMVDVPEAVVSEQNPNRMDANGKQSNENVWTPECVEDIDVLVHKKREKTDVLKKPEQIDICKNLEETVVLKKHEEFDTLMIPEEIVVSKKLEETVPENYRDRTIAIVLEQNPNGPALKTPESLEEVRKMKRKEVKDESYMAKKRKRRLEKALARSAAIISELEKKKKESCGYFDTLMIQQNPNGLSLRTSESLEEVRNMKRKQVKDELLHKMKWAQMKKSRLEKALATSAAIISELEKKKESCGYLDNLMIPEEIGTCKKHEEVDISLVPEETDASKKPEESHPETSCDQTITTVPNAIVSEQNSNRMAANGKQSSENTRTPEFVEEIDVLVHKKHEQADILKKPEQIDICKNPEETVLLKKHEEYDTLMLQEEIVVSKKIEETVPETSCDRTIAIVSEQSPKGLALRTSESLEEVKKMKKRYRKRKREFIPFSKNPVIFKLQSRCRNTSPKQLKRHVATHYSEMIDLREEIANALKLAKDPAKLVLKSIGRFFVTVSNIISTLPGSHPLYVGRLASVLILECFVMISSDGIEIAEQDREYAAEAAVDWRKRMINEGGPGHTDEVDARGLLLLISGFGIQDDVFTIQDIMDLIRASNVKGISTALRRSVFLIPKIPEVIHLMVKNNLEIEAVDIANTFGVEYVCHPRNILMTNLHNKIKDIQNASPLQMNNENVITPESLEEVDILKKPEEIAALKKPEEIDILEKIESLEDVDILKKPEETAALKRPEEVDIFKKIEQTDICKNPEETAVLKKPEEAGTLMIPEENGTWKKTKETGVVSVLQNLCQRMNSKKLKRHIGAHISEMNNLRVDIASALKLAEDPAKLVTNSIGRFFEQSNKTFRPRAGSHLNKENVGRMAVVLILECFVMISGDGIEITKTVRKYAADAAAVWRNRIIKEGGLRHTDEVDARGLLLLISGFGIQDHVFSIQDLIDLIRASNVKGIATALRRSVFLMPKIQEIIYKMVHNNLEIEAVDVAYAFGLEGTHHPGKILTTYLDKKIKDIQNASPVHMLDAVKQHLFDLTSVKQCLESHNVDPSTLLPNFKINERIQNLEIEVNEWKLIQKRQSSEKPIHQEAKRACVSHQNMPHQHRPVGHYRSPQPSTSYITAHSTSPGNKPGYYVQTVHTPNGQPYGWHGPYGQHYPGHGQTYGSQPYYRPWEQGQLVLFPGFLGSQPPSSDLYRFAEFVEKGSHDSRT